MSYIIWTCKKLINAKKNLYYTNHKKLGKICVIIFIVFGTSYIFFNSNLIIAKKKKIQCELNEINKYLYNIVEKGAFVNIIVLKH